jgi:hypothetical protein
MKAGDMLLGAAKSNSQFVKTILEGVGIFTDGQKINYLRHSIASTLHEHGTDDDIAKLSRKMKHSLRQSYDYKRRLLDVPPELIAAAKRGPPAKASNRGRPTTT